MLKSLAAATVPEAAMAHYGYTSSLPVISGTIGALLMSISMFYNIHNNESARVRQFGQDLEKNAARALFNIMPKNWVLKTGVRSNGGGDIDIVLQTDSGVVAIEIKAYQGLRPQNGGVVKMNGRELDKDPIEQVHRAAQTVNGFPIVWMPAAKYANSFVCQDALIVNGDAKFLLSEIKRNQS